MSADFQLLVRKGLRVKVVYRICCGMWNSNLKRTLIFILWSSKTRIFAEQDTMDFFYYYSSLLFLLQFYTLSEGRPNSDIDIGTCKCQSFQTCQWSNESFKRINSGTQFPGETQLFKGISVLKPCIYLFFDSIRLLNNKSLFTVGF